LFLPVDEKLRKACNFWYRSKQSVKALTAAGGKRVMLRLSPEAP